jgi:hypothetical protein
MKEHLLPKSNALRVRKDASKQETLPSLRLCLPRELPRVEVAGQRQPSILLLSSGVLAPIHILHDPCHTTMEEDLAEEKRWRLTRQRSSTG